MYIYTYICYVYIYICKKIFLHIDIRIYKHGGARPVPTAMKILPIRMKSEEHLQSNSHVRQDPPNHGTRAVLYAYIYIYIYIYMYIYRYIYM